jgi:hypothetical protein
MTSAHGDKEAIMTNKEEERFARQNEAEKMANANVDKALDKSVRAHSSGILLRGNAVSLGRYHALYIYNNYRHKLE